MKNHKRIENLEDRTEIIYRVGLSFWGTLHGEPYGDRNVLKSLDIMYFKHREDAEDLYDYLTENIGTKYSTQCIEPICVHSKGASLKRKKELAEEYQADE